MGTGNKTGVKGQGPGGRKDSRTTIFYITGNALRIAQKLKTLYPGAQVLKFTPAAARRTLALQWQARNALIFIMATGIVVRTVAPLLKDKRSDPAVVVMDEKGEYVISLLSGHLGGANKLAVKAAGFLGGHPVITTASDVQGRTALDIWAEEKNLFAEHHERLKRLSTRIVNGKRIAVYADAIDLSAVPEEFDLVASPDDADMIISERRFRKKALFLRPPNLFAGIGCNRGTTKDEIQKAFTSILRRNGLSEHSIRNIASIDLKRDEAGLLAFARTKDLSVRFFPAEALNRAAKELGMRGSNRVRAATGAVAVSEPAALLAARQTSDRAEIIIPKVKRGNVTLAIAKAKFAL